MGRIDEIFYELNMRMPGFDKASAKVQRELRAMGVQSGVAASSVDRISQSTKGAATSASRHGKEVSKTTGIMSKFNRRTGSSLGRIARWTQSIQGGTFSVGRLGNVMGSLTGPGGVLGLLALGIGAVGLSIQRFRNDMKKAREEADAWEFSLRAIKAAALAIVDPLRRMRDALKGLNEQQRQQFRIGLETKIEEARRALARQTAEFRKQRTLGENFIGFTEKQSEVLQILKENLNEARQALEDFRAVPRDVEPTEAAEQAVEALREELAELRGGAGRVEIDIGVEALPLQEQVIEITDLMARLVRKFQEGALSFGDMIQRATAIRGVFRDIGIQSQNIDSALRQAADATADFKVKGEDVEDNLSRTLLTIRDIGDGTIDLLDAFLGLDDVTEDILNNLLQAATASIRLIDAIRTGAGPLQIGAGVIGLAGGLAGLIGAATGEERFAQTIRENSRSLQRLRDSVDELRGSLDITGADFTNALQALQRTGPLIGDIDPDTIRDFQSQFGRLAEELHGVGLSMEELRKIARKFRITIPDDAEGAAIAINQLREALQEFEDDFTGFADNVSGLLERLRVGEDFGLPELDTAAERFRFLRDELRALGKAGEGIPALSGLLTGDITTAEGRRRQEEIIRSIVRDLLAGRITAEQLGVTQNEALQLLREMLQLLGDIEQEQPTEEQTQDVRRSVQITELQTDKWLSFASTGLELDRRRNETLEDILGALGGRPLTPPAVPGPGASVVIENVTVGAGATEMDARRTARALKDELDKELGREFRNRQRLMGTR